MNSVTCTVLFGQPQQEIASLLQDRLRKCMTAEIVAGFLTVEGATLIQPPFATAPEKLQTLIVGAGTYRAFDALDQLLGLGVDPASLFVHLGHTRRTGPKAKHRFYRYHPMLHSKVFYMEHDDGSASAFVGSHNITGFALKGLNGEASVLLEGPVDSQQFKDIRAHIASAKIQSQQYSPSNKAALAWWTHQAFEGIRDKANDAPRDSESKKTIVILAENSKGEAPSSDDVIYFELPLALGQVSSLQSEVHLFIFDSLPATPWAGLQMVGQAKHSVWCKTLGLEMAKGGVELKADWSIDGNTTARLSKTPDPFRPTPADAMQQVRVQAYGPVRGDFEYLFDSGKKKWIPVLASDNSFPMAGQQLPWEELPLDTGESSEDERNVIAPLQVDEQFQRKLEGLKLKPNPEHLPWELVSRLAPEEDESDQGKYKQALVEYSPEGGSFIMLSLRRRQK